MKQKNILLLVACICALSIIVMVVALCDPKTVTADFVRPPFDASAQVGTPTVPDDFGWQTLDAKLFQLSVCGKIIPHENSADIWLTNPESNDVWLKLRVLDASGNIIGETGILRAGEYVQSVTLTTVPPVGTPITLKLMAYEPETYHSAGAVTLNTTISAE